MLPPATDLAWQFLQDQPALGGFVLLGGSALSLRLAHRQSEDLDFGWPGTQLPRLRLDQLLRAAQGAGVRFERHDDEAALQDFAAGGMELLDYQQNFLVNGAVKVSFFTLEVPFIRQLDPEPAPAPRPRVATLSELFRCKCLVSARRSKTRDWVDLYLLLTRHGFTIQDYQAAFARAGSEPECDLGLARLSSGVPQRDDEGYLHLLANPPSLEEMRAFFSEQRRQLEASAAAAAFRPAGRPKN